MIPAAFITYGALGIKTNPIADWDEDIREDLGSRGIRTTLDDYTRFLPIVTVYGLNLTGIKGKNNFLDRSVILGTGTTLMFSSVKIIKNNTSVRRPDGISLSSFPSGHTALSFMGAEFLHQEYGHLSPWYSVAGYTVAAGTGFLRMYNDKHWFTDVIAGAGIGILSMKIAYWLHPTIKRIFYKKSKKESNFGLSVAPLYDGEQLTIATHFTF